MGVSSHNPGPLFYPNQNYHNDIKSPLLFRIHVDKTSLGVSCIGVATPWDDCPYAKSNANTFVCAHAYRVFLTSCVGINLGDIPWGLQHPRDVPSVDPSTLGQKTLYKLASLKYCFMPYLCSLPWLFAVGVLNPHPQSSRERWG